MVVKLNNKEIKIPEEEIKRNMKILEITEEEAIQMYLEDEGYEVNEEVEKLTKKAKENKTNIRGENEKPRVKRNVEPKVNIDKENIIKLLENALKQAGIDAKITNKSKIIDFSYNNKQFTVNLVEHRQKKA